MLARISNQLILIGRHLEHAELMASITKVYYLSAMDAPFPAYKSTVWSFILKANQASQAYALSYPQIQEENVLHFVALAEENPASIKSLVVNARELAREARSCLSAELWEHINGYYHNIHAYTEEKLQQKGFYSFAQKVEQHSFTIKGYLNTVMLHNEAWKLLNLGYHLERAVLANTLLLYTLQEIKKSKPADQATAIGEYLMRALLEGLGAYEMYKQYYQAQVNKKDFIHVLLFNKAYPRSILYNLLRIAALNNASGIATQKEEGRSLQQIAKVATALESQQAEILQGNELIYLEKNLKSLQAIIAEAKEKAQPA